MVRANQHHGKVSLTPKPSTHGLRTPLERRLRKELAGSVLFDRFSRARYSTDASIYQIVPLGVVVPHSRHDLEVAVQIALEAGVPIIMRGGGTSQGGQPIGRGLVIDTSAYVNQLLQFDSEGQRVIVEPGIVLDTLNRHLKQQGFFFPVDPSTANRATLGGMAGNNSAGARSIRYGLMADNVLSIDAILSDGTASRFGYGTQEHLGNQNPFAARLHAVATSLYRGNEDEFATRVPKVLRHVAGYNLHRLGKEAVNYADLLVGSEGTLAVFTELTLRVCRLPTHRVLGVCHFPTLRAAMQHTKDIVALSPSAVELVDRTLIELARRNAAFGPAVDRFLRGNPGALLLVEFTAEDATDALRHLTDLDDTMGTLGFEDSVVRAVDPEFQDQVWSVRKAALNIVMSMKGDGKPVSFIEDCAVPLEHLADYTQRLEEVFERHGTQGTWYAHASVGCLHVRPTLNLKDPDDIAKMRRIAEEAHEIVRQFKGSHSGEHGDGLVRSEFIEPNLGAKIAKAFEALKREFDPNGLFNPGKIVGAPRMDDRDLFRYGPQYQEPTRDTAYDWSEWGGFTQAVEMCNNNGACRKYFDGVMCPSFRATRDEMHTTRGRANTLRMALTGQLGREALSSDELYETMELCVGCKACKRECPTGVDMARMKTEFLFHYRKHHAPGLGEMLVAHLPRYAPYVAPFSRLPNLFGRWKPIRHIGEHLTGISAERDLPQWHADRFRSSRPRTGESIRNVGLFVDTFSRYFEPDNVDAAITVLEAAGYEVSLVGADGGGRPLCCGRTYLNEGFVTHARAELSRTLEVLARFAHEDIPVVGLEPSCLLTFRDEALALLPGSPTTAVANNTFTLEEFLINQRGDNALSLTLKSVPGRAAVHGHCHQKAFGVAEHVTTVLNWIPGFSAKPIVSSCCGMAGSFGYEARHLDISMQMGELDLLPRVRNESEDTFIVADGTSCRAQIKQGTGKTAHHAVSILASACE